MQFQLTQTQDYVNHISKTHEETQNTLIETRKLVLQKEQELNAMVVKMRAQEISSNTQLQEIQARETETETYAHLALGQKDGEIKNLTDAYMALNDNIMNARLQYETQIQDLTTRITEAETYKNITIEQKENEIFNINTAYTALLETISAAQKEHETQIQKMQDTPLNI